MLPPASAVAQAGAVAPRYLSRYRGFIAAEMAKVRRIIALAQNAGSSTDIAAARRTLALPTQNHLLDLAESVLPAVAETMGADTPPLRVELLSADEFAATGATSSHAQAWYPPLEGALRALGFILPTTRLLEEQSQIFRHNIAGAFCEDTQRVLIPNDLPLISAIPVLMEEAAHAVQDAKTGGIARLLRARRHSFDATCAMTAAFEWNADAVASSVLGAWCTSDPEVADDLNQLWRQGPPARLDTQPLPVSRWTRELTRHAYSMNAPPTWRPVPHNDPLGLSLIARLPETTADWLDSTRQVPSPQIVTPQLASLLPGAPSTPEFVTSLGRLGVDFVERHADSTAPIHELLGQAWCADRLSTWRLDDNRLVAVWVIQFANSSAARTFKDRYEDTFFRFDRVAEARHDVCVVTGGFRSIEQRLLLSHLLDSLAGPAPNANQETWLEPGR